MSIAKDNSSKLLAALLMVLVGVAAMPLISALPFQRTIPSQRLVLQSGSQPDFLMQIEPSQFLMQNSTAASPGIAFTPLNGFVGNVTLSATVSPVQLSGPTVSFNPPIVKLDASLPGSPLYTMIVNTTSRTPSGVYAITVIGSSPLGSHYATATVGVTSLFVPANGAELVYKADLTAGGSVGGSTVLTSTFMDLGYVSIGITKLAVSLSFGTFQVDQNCTGSPPGPMVCISPYVWLDPYQQKTTSLAIQIPDNASVGSYSATITVSWDVGPTSIYEKPGPDLIVHGYLMVYANPPNSTPPSSSPPPFLGVLGDIGLLRVVFPALSGVAAILVLIVGLAVRNERKKQSPLRQLLITNPSCARCGTPVAWGTRFCGHCGNPIL